MLRDGSARIVAVWGRSGWENECHSTGKERPWTSDRIEGELKEQEGKLTGDEVREKQGQAQEKWGEAKDKTDDLKDEVDDRI